MALYRLFLWDGPEPVYIYMYLRTHSYKPAICVCAWDARSESMSCSLLALYGGSLSTVSYLPLLDRAGSTAQISLIKLTFFLASFTQYPAVPNQYVYIYPSVFRLTSCRHSSVLNLFTSSLCALSYFFFSLVAPRGGFFVVG